MSVIIPLCTLLLAAAVTADVFYFNEEMDGFFSQFRADIRRANNSQFPLPNIHASYDKRLIFLNLHGEMNGTQGSFQDMSTIHRSSNVTIVTAKEYFVFRTEFGFEDLKIRYKYAAKMLGLPFNGDLELKVEKNSLYIEILVNLTTDRCSGDVLTIRNLKFTALESISVNVTGFSLVNPLVGYWLTHSFNHISPSATHSIEDSLRAFFHLNIRKLDFCKFGSVPENIPFDDTDSSDDLSSDMLDYANATSKDIMGAFLN